MDCLGMSVQSMITCGISAVVSFFFYKQAMNRSPLQMFVAFMMVLSIICATLNLVSATQCTRDQENYRY